MATTYKPNIWFLQLYLLLLNKLRKTLHPYRLMLIELAENALCEMVRETYEEGSQKEVMVIKKVGYVTAKTPESPMALHFYTKTLYQRTTRSKENSVERKSGDKMTPSVFFFSMW